MGGKDRVTNKTRSRERRVIEQAFNLRRCFIEQFTPLIVNATERPPVQRTGRTLHPIAIVASDTVPLVVGADFHDWSSVTPVNGNIPVHCPPPPRHRAASNPRYFYWRGRSKARGKY